MLVTGCKHPQKCVKIKLKDRLFEGWSSQFCLKIIQGLKECPFKRNLPDYGGIPYTLSVKLTVSTNLSVFSGKENFLWMKF